MRQPLREDKDEPDSGAPALMRLKVVLKNRIVESTGTGTVGVPRENKRPRVRIYSELVD